MYLPMELPKARVLITVKTYPNPSEKYDELVCNAGFLESGEWIRIYPIRFRSLPYDQQYTKYSWIELDLIRRQRDLRRESYMPKLGIDEQIAMSGVMSTGRDRKWAERKRLALSEVFDSMSELIALAKARGTWKSLGTVKPKEIVGFEIEADNREWSKRVKTELQQLNLFERSSRSADNLEVVRKLPYKYYYRFLSEGDNRPRRMMIEDWEIGALYWNCLAQTEGDEIAANELVRQKYETEFFEKDLYFFVGTTLANHIRAPNPFVIIGVFYL